MILFRSLIVYLLFGYMWNVISILQKSFLTGLASLVILIEFIQVFPDNNLCNTMSKGELLIPKNLPVFVAVTM